MEKINQQSRQKPVIFLAFANDRLDNAAYLRNLPKELRGIREELEKAKSKNLCEVVERSNASIEDILDVFQDDTYKNRIALFHYGGHASGYRLLLESLAGGHAPAHREGLAAFLARQEGLKFVFLNGCSTQQHALELTQAGIPAVVGTSQSINDEVATNLSIRFYSGIANGASLEKAWLDAEDYIKIQKGTANFRALYWEGKEEIEDRFPWDIFYKKGGEKVKGWNLPEAANDPLFGMPEIPGTYGLPETPFLFLDRYERQHAKLFFGRSRCIRELYNRITDPKSPPIILLYGQSGVGKSSLLDAGLLPRIEESHTVLYIRRIQEKGLLGSVEESLQRDFSNIDHLTLGEKWKQVESQTNKPLVVILDQVEEVFTRPNTDLPNEFQEFMETLKKTFEKPALYPGGKLILGYRKEYHPEIEKAFGVNELPRSWVFLEPLARRDIMEVVTGLTQTSELIQRYNVKLDEELPVIIADDLLADKNSPVAPVLQILLTKMWNSSKKDEFSPGREFTVEQYQALKRQGIAMKDFFEQQMEKLKNWKQEVVDSGLALDILKYHTTEMGTACSRGIEELRHTYGDMLDILEELIKKLKDFYLLTEAQQGKADTSLAHDTLAPVVIKEYTDSEKPGQRAARILTAKREDFNRDKKGVWLDEVDLKLVEQGRNGMRALDEIEKKLLEVSRERKLQREKEKKRIRGIGITLIAVIIIAAIFAFYLWRTAEKSYKKSEANRLILLAERKVNEDQTIALQLAEKAWNLYKSDLVTKTIYKIYRENRFYNIIAKQEKNIGDPAFLPDGQYILGGSDDNIARLWNLQEKELKCFEGPQAAHEEGVISVAFSPDGHSIFAVSVDGTARFLDLPGKKILEFEDHEGPITYTAFSPDGKSILIGSVDGSAREWDIKGKEILAVREHEGPVASVAFSPDGKTFLTGSWDGKARLWDREGRKIRVFKGNKYNVTSVAFSPNGEQILIGSMDKTARLWEIGGKELQVFRGHSHYVTSVAFSADGNSILTGSLDKTARLWDKKGNKIVALEHEGPVTSVAFSPDGNSILTGSMDKTARLWNRKGEEIQVFRGHRHYVTSVVFSPDGNYILTGSLDKTARLWDRKGKESLVLKVTRTKNKTPDIKKSIRNDLHPFWGYEKKIISAAFSSNDQYILTGSLDSTARLWDREGQQLHVFKGHKAPVSSVAFSQDGESILTGSWDSTARLWNWTGKELQVFKGHKYPVSSITFSSDGKYILTGSEDSTARLWDRQGMLIQVFEGHQAPVRAIAFSSNGKYILTGSEDKTVRLWDLKGKELKVLEGHTDIVWSVAFSSDRKYILTGAWDKSVRLWDLMGNQLDYFIGHKDVITTVAFSPGNKYILSGSWDKTLRKWDCKGNKLQVFKKHTDSVYSADFSPDGKFILTGSEDKTALFWDLEGNPVQDFKEHKGVVYSVAFSPKANSILTASRDYTVRLWNLEGKELQKFKGHNDYIYSAAFSPDGQFILTGSKDTTARLWDLKGNLLQVFNGHKESVYAVAFSPDGKYILTGSRDKTARLWSLDGKLVQVFEGHQEPVRAVAFSPKREYIITGSRDNTARLWDIKGNTLQTFIGHTGWVYSVAFSPDGEYILTGSSDKTARLWNLSGNHLQTFKGHTGTVRDVLFSPDPKYKYVLTASDDGTARLWEIRMPLEEFLKKGNLQPLSDEQQKEYGIED